MGKISRFGLMELSRQRLRPALSEGSHVTCPRCNGVGVIRDTESSALHVLRILQEEAMKEGTAAVHAQVPVEVATFLLNEKRADIAKLELRHRVSMVLIPNKYIETPHYHVERLRHDDPRLDEAKPSYDRAAELAPALDTPYAAANAEDKGRTRQEAVVKGVVPETPAPVSAAPVAAPPTPAAAPVAVAAAPAKGLWSRIVEFFSGGPAPAAKAAPVAAAAGSGERRTERGGKSERRPDGRRGEGRREGRSEREGERRPPREGRGRDEARRDRGEGRGEGRSEARGEGRSEGRGDSAREPRRDATAPRDEAATREPREGREGRDRRRGGRGERRPQEHESAPADVPAAAASEAAALAEDAIARARNAAPASPAAALMDPATSGAAAPETAGEADAEGGEQRRRRRRRGRGRGGRGAEDAATRDGAEADTDESAELAGDAQEAASHPDGAAQVPLTPAAPQLEAAPAAEPIAQALDAPPAPSPVATRAEPVPQAPAPAPVAVPAEQEFARAAAPAAWPVAAPAPLPLAALTPVLDGAGLILVQTDAARHADAAARMAAEPRPARVPRERPVLPPLDSTPLVQVETRAGDKPAA
jgi:ribonuclease E